MPELPEVQMVVNTLRPNVVGRSISGAQLMRSDILLPADFDLSGHLVGLSIGAIDRRGKRIIFTLTDGNRFYIHLGMTGRLTYEPAQNPLLPHTHLVIHFDQESTGNSQQPTHQLRFRDPRRFGGIWWLGDDRTDEMGPEPLTLKTPKFAAAIARTRRPIKNALLDQSVIAGLGNIYVDESLFYARIHPLTIAADLQPRQIADLNRSIKAVLKKALHHRGSTLRDYFDANGDPGGFQNLHAVYDREDKKCRRCRTPIQRIVLGGRSTHFCPKCQS